MRTLSPEGASSFSFFFLKLGERIQMLKVLGCYSADKAAQPTANSNLITNELSLCSQKDSNPICFFIFRYANNTYLLQEANLTYFEKHVFQKEFFDC